MCVCACVFKCVHVCARVCWTWSSPMVMDQLDMELRDKDVWYVGDGSQRGWCTSTHSLTCTHGVLVTQNIQRLTESLTLMKQQISKKIFSTCQQTHLGREHNV